MTAVEGLGFLAAGMVLDILREAGGAASRGGDHQQSGLYPLWLYCRDRAGIGSSPHPAAHKCHPAGGSTQRQFTFRPLGSNSATSPPSTDSLARTP